MDIRYTEGRGDHCQLPTYDRLLLIQPQSLQVVDSIRGVIQQRLTGAGEGAGVQSGIQTGRPTFIGAAVAGIGSVPRYIAAAQQQKALVAFWDIKKEAIAYQVATPEVMTTLAFHPNGSLLFAGSRTGCLYCWQLSGVVPLSTTALRVRSSEGASLLRRCWPAHYGACAALLVEEDRIISGGTDGSIKQFSLYDILSTSKDSENGQAMQTADCAVTVSQSWSGHSQAVTALCAPYRVSEVSGVRAVSLVSSALDRTIKVWSQHSGSPLGTFLLPAPSRCVIVNTLEAAPVICAACDDGLVHLLPLSATTTTDGASQQNVDSQADASSLKDLGGNRSETCSEAPTAHTRHLRGHTGAVISCALLSDNKLASCAADGVRFWDLVSGATIKHISHVGGLLTGMHVLSTSTDCNLLVLPPLAPLRRALAQPSETGTVRILDRGAMRRQMRHSQRRAPYCSHAEQAWRGCRHTGPRAWFRYFDAVQSRVPCTEEMQAVP
ncbi:WD domain, G-beta repeat-containing protein [Toxoplasma gondii VAND]|uniref:WD domain, G-beta repeat-containing protein n=1 Tax=Toxoplasma gondii VAND TaxID=933077 RepID=A0A086PSD4_TOXGO|nr:WD domain, G-beta repeat-containing protein [Toxoplasma gondii VAND]